MTNKNVFLTYGRFGSDYQMIMPTDTKAAAFQVMTDSIERGDCYDRYLVQHWIVGDSSSSEMKATVTYEMFNDGHGYVLDSYNWEFDSPQDVI